MSTELINRAKRLRLILKVNTIWSDHCVLLSDTQLLVLFLKKLLLLILGKGMCCWFGWHFHDSLSYYGVTFSIELLEWGLTHFHDLENFHTSK